MLRSKNFFKVIKLKIIIILDITFIFLTVNVALIYFCNSFVFPGGLAPFGSVMFNVELVPIITNVTFLVPSSTGTGIE